MRQRVRGPAIAQTKIQLISNYTHFASIEISGDFMWPTHDNQAIETLAHTASVHRRWTIRCKSNQSPAHISLSLSCHIRCRARRLFHCEKTKNVCHVVISPEITMFLSFSPPGSMSCSRCPFDAGKRPGRHRLCVCVCLSFYHPICWQLVERKRLHAPHGPSTTTRRKNTSRHNKNI